MADYIPRNDADFNNWQNNFITYATTNQKQLGLTAEQITTLTTSKTNWQTTYTNHITAQATVARATEDKDTSRKNHEQLLRNLAQQLQNSPTITNGDRAALGITVKEANRSSRTVPTTRPSAIINNQDRLRHVINFFDENTPTRRAKPEGVMGCEIWVKIGEAPKNPDDLNFLGLDTATPYTIDYPSQDGGKPAHYMLRWVNRRGEPGPWSQTFNSQINQ